MRTNEYAGRYNTTYLFLENLTNGHDLKCLDHSALFCYENIYSQPFTTDAIRTDDLVWFSRFGAVCEQDTETLFWLIGPPVAGLI